MSLTVTRKIQNPETKVPAWMALLVQRPDGKSSGMFCEVNFVEYTEEILVFEWEYCFNCSGYSSKQVSRNCLFAPYSETGNESTCLTFDMDMPGFPEGARITGWVEEIRRSNGMDYIAVRINKIPDEARKYLEQRLEVRG